MFANEKSLGFFSINHFKKWLPKREGGKSARKILMYTLPVKEKAAGIML
jgi:hypothetical protein